MSEFEQNMICALSFVCAGALSVVILHRGIKEGVVIKCGLVLMALALYASGALTFSYLHSVVGLWRATVMLQVGLAIVIAGYAYKVRCGKDRRIVRRNWRQL